MGKRNSARTGDILFYRNGRSTGIFGKIIGFCERLVSEGAGRYYHVSIVDETLDFQFEASIPRTRRSAIDWSDPDIEVWRIMSASDVQLSDMVTAAKMTTGEWYGIGKSLSSLIRSKRLMICTQYVIDAAFFGNIDLQDDRDPLVSPDEFSKHTSLYQVAI